MKSMAIYIKSVVLISALTGLSCSRGSVMPQSKTADAAVKSVPPAAPVGQKKLSLSESLALQGGSLALCGDGGCQAPVGGQTASTPATTVTQPAAGTTAATGIPEGAVQVGNGYWTDAKDSTYQGVMQFYQKGASGYQPTNWFGGYGEFDQNSDFKQDTTNKNFVMVPGTMFEDGSGIKVLDHTQTMATTQQPDGSWAGKITKNGDPYVFGTDPKLQVQNTGAVYKNGAWTYNWQAVNGSNNQTFQTNTYDLMTAMQGGNFQYQIPGSQNPLTYNNTSVAGPNVDPTAALLQGFMSALFGQSGNILQSEQSEQSGNILQ